MKIKQKLFLFLVTILGIFIINIGKVQATSLALSPSSGLAGSSFTISGNGFTANQSVIVKWDSVGLDTSNTLVGEDGNYSSSANVPAGASAGDHTVKVTGPGQVFQPSYGPKNTWISQIFPRALAAEDIIASALFTVTAPPVTPLAETPVADTTTTPTNINTAPANSNTKNTTPPPANSNPATAEPVAPTDSTVTSEPTAQTESTNELEEETKMCYFPWWLWLVLILITVVNLALFWSRFWKKKKQKE